MHAVILAGGFGTRLKSVVSDVPKPLAPIAGEPFLSRLIRMLVRSGISSVTLSVHHRWEKIRDYFILHPAPVPLDFAVEPEPLGTGGAMAFALTYYKGGEPVLVLNGDSFVQVDYRALLIKHREKAARLSMVLREVPDTGRYGEVAVSGGVVTAFGEGRPGTPGLINAGVYLMEPRLFEISGLSQAFSFERDFLPPRLPILQPIAFLAENYFIDIGVPEDYARAQRELPDRLG